MTTAPDLSSWPTKQQTADILQVSFRTLDKFVLDGKLQSASRRQPGKPPATVYNPADVEKLRQERQPAAHVMPLKEDSPQPARSLARTAQSDSFLQTFKSFLETFNAHFAQPAESVERPLFMTIKEASVYTGLPQTTLRWYLEKELLRGIKTGRGWRIRRKDLEEL